MPNISVLVYISCTAFSQVRRAEIRCTANAPKPITKAEVSHDQDHPRNHQRLRRFGLARGARAERLLLNDGFEEYCIGLEQTLDEFIDVATLYLILFDSLPVKVDT